jgi:hypothetical protein
MPDASIPDPFEAFAVRKRREDHPPLPGGKLGGSAQPPVQEYRVEAPGKVKGMVTHRYSGAPVPVEKTRDDVNIKGFSTHHHKVDPSKIRPEDLDPPKGFKRY